MDEHDLVDDIIWGSIFILALCFGIMVFSGCAIAQQQPCKNKTLNAKMQKAYDQLKKDGFNVSVRCYKQGYIDGVQNRINYERGN